jgi:uncharacterized protein (TIGR02117 family)
MFPATTPQCLRDFNQKWWAIVLLLLGSCSSMPDPAAIPLSDTSNTIYFIYRDWHTSIMVDGSRFREFSKAAHSGDLGAEVKDARYVRVGWGDGDYFTGKSTTVITATRALLLSGYSAVQFLGYESDPFQSIPAENSVPLAISDAALAELVAYIDASLAYDAAGASMRLPNYVENSGVFLQSSKRYGLLSNCNTWSGTALQVAGLPIRSALHLTAQSVFEQARAISDYQQQHRRNP